MDVSGRRLTGRDYKSAAMLFVRAGNRGLGGTRPLLTYALAMAGRTAEARQLVRTARPANDDEKQFWQWMEELLNSEK